MNDSQRQVKWLNIKVHDIILRECRKEWEKLWNRPRRTHKDGHEIGRFWRESWTITPVRELRQRGSGSVNYGYCGGTKSSTVVADDSGEKWTLWWALQISGKSWEYPQGTALSSNGQEWQWGTRHWDSKEDRLEIDRGKRWRRGGSYRIQQHR